MLLSRSYGDVEVKACIGILVSLSVIRVVQLCTTLQPELAGAEKPPEFVKQLWVIYNLIPIPLRIEPQQLLEVTYPKYIDLEVGRFLFPLDLQVPPVKVFWPTQYVNSYYTLIMTDLDAPSDRDRSKSEWLHWMLVNIRGPWDDRVNETIARYIGPHPARGSGLHRYIYQLFRQPKKIAFTAEPHLGNDKNDSRRERFSTRRFATKYGFGDPVAVTFCLAQFWHYNKTV